jgi:hypothetical protein
MSFPPSPKIWSASSVPSSSGSLAFVPATVAIVQTLWCGRPPLGHPGEGEHRRRSFQADAARAGRAAPA